MHYQSDGTQVTSRPAPAAVTGTPGYVSAGNPVTGVPASDDDPDLMNAIIDELCSIPPAAGIALDKTNNHQVVPSIGILAHRRTVLSGSGEWVAPYTGNFRIIRTGGGGGGSDCHATGGAGSQNYGGGGGAGATEIDILFAVEGTSTSYSVGQGGTHQTDGAATTFGALPAAAGGHGSPGFLGSGGVQYSAGGLGGAGTYSGGDGGDGQNGTLNGAGNGRASFWGGGSRASGNGVSNANPARCPGSGGGGVYDNANTGTQYSGNSGANGIIVIEG